MTIILLLHPKIKPLGALKLTSRVCPECGTLKKRLTQGQPKQLNPTMTLSDMAEYMQNDTITLNHFPFGRNMPTLKSAAVHSPPMPTIPLTCCRVGCYSVSHKQYLRSLPLTGFSWLFQ